MLARSPLFTAIPAPRAAHVIVSVQCPSRTGPSPSPLAQPQAALAAPAALAAALTLAGVLLCAPWSAKPRTFGVVARMPYPLFWLSCAFYTLCDWVSGLKPAPFRLAELSGLHVQSQVRPGAWARSRRADGPTRRRLAGSTGGGREGCSWVVEQKGCTQGVEPRPFNCPLQRCAAS